MLRPKYIIVFLLVASLLTVASLAQDKEKIKQLTPTHKGSTGLFNLFTADTLRQGEFSISAVAHKFHRDPGDIDYTIFPVTFTVGLSDRLELFGSFEAYKRVNADAITVNKVYPNGLLNASTMSRLSPGVHSVLGQFTRGFPPAVLSDGRIGFYQDSPFMDVGFGDGSGDLTAGLKINLLSERRGSSIGLAIQPIYRTHLTDQKQHLLRGLTSGASDYGIDGILSKNLGGGATLTANAGFMIADDYRGIDRQNRFNWGVGVDIPAGSNKVHFIGELVGSKFYCTKLESINGEPIFENVVSPFDAYAGLRVFPSEWLSISGAANFHLRNAEDIDSSLVGSDRLGFYTQVAFQRKINELPTIECSIDKRTVTEGDSATVRATAYDPDDDSLSVTWKSSGGRLSQQDSSATLNTSGLAPGRYSVMAEVSDGDNVASCSEDVTVEKRKMAPTISCQPSSTSITEGESTNLSARASDPNGDALTYSWTVDGQSVSNNSTTFEFGSAGKSIGSHTVRVTVTDVDNMSASCEMSVTINRRPNKDPSCSLSLSKTDVYAGETITASAQANDPDNDPLEYAWKVDGRSRSESGNRISINTGGMAGGSHSVVLSVTDDRGGSCSDTKSFSMREKIVIQMDKTKPDNKAKAQLDEIALKLQQNPQLRARVTGHTDDKGSDEANMKVGQKRADSVKDYLVSQHNIAEDRIEAKSAGEGSPVADNGTEDGRKQNRRVEIELFVP